MVWNLILETSSGRRYVVYSKVVAALLNLETTLLYGSDFDVNNSVIWAPHFITAVAAPALKHGTQANAWHTGPAVLVEKAWQKRHNLNVITNLSNYFYVIFIIVSAWW